MEKIEEREEEISLREVFNIIVHYKWVLISLVVIAIVASLVITPQLTKIYQTSTLVMVKKDEGMDNLFSKQLSAIGLSNQTDKVATYAQILKSRGILEGVIKELNLMNQETGELIKTQTLREKVSVSSGEEISLITVTVNYSDPKVAKEIANTLVEKFKLKNRKMNQVELRGASQFIVDQLNKVESNLKNIENKLLHYKENNNVVLPEKQGEVTLEKLTELQSQRAKVEVDLKQSRVSLEEVKKQLASQDKELVSTKTITDNPLVKQYRAQLSELEVRLAGLKESYTRAHPKVVEVKTKIKEIKNRLQQAVEKVVGTKTKTINPLYSNLNQKQVTLQTKMIALTAQLDTYQQQIEKAKSQLTALPEKELKLARLKRERKVAETVYTMLRERKEEIQLQKAMKTSNLVVVDPAVIKEKPIKPQLKLNLAISIMLAIFIGIGTIFLIEYLDTTIKSEEEVEEITDLPVLGVIPNMEEINHDQGYGRGGE